MNISFLSLLVVAGIFRFLAEDAKKAFRRRLVSLLPRKVMRQHLRALLREYPQHFAEFRRRILPFSALHIFLNALACGVFIFALWFAPPEALSDWALLFIRYSSLVIVPIALLADAVFFARVLISTFARPLLDGADAEP